MYDWEDLIEVYSMWRWKIYKSFLKNDKQKLKRRSLRETKELRLWCNIRTRMKFSEYAQLPYIISLKDMNKLEDYFWKEVE